MINSDKVVHRDVMKASVLPLFSDANLWTQLAVASASTAIGVKAYCRRINHKLLEIRPGHTTKFHNYMGVSGNLFTGLLTVYATHSAAV